MDSHFHIHVKDFAPIIVVFFVLDIIHCRCVEKIKETLEQNISNIKNQVNEAEKLKEDAKNILIEHEKNILHCVERRKSAK